MELAGLLAEPHPYRPHDLNVLFGKGEPAINFRYSGCPGSPRNRESKSRPATLLRHGDDVVDGVLGTLIVRFGGGNDLTPADVAVVVMLVLGNTASAVGAHR